MLIWIKLHSEGGLTSASKLLASRSLTSEWEVGFAHVIGEQQNVWCSSMLRCRLRAVRADEVIRFQSMLHAFQRRPQQSKLVISRVNASAPASPIITPTSTSAIPRPTTSLITSDD